MKSCMNGVDYFRLLSSLIKFKNVVKFYVHINKLYLLMPGHK